MNSAIREAANQARQKPVKLTHNQEVRALMLMFFCVICSDTMVTVMQKEI
jgi:hypothetical protein